MKRKTPKPQIPYFKQGLALASAGLLALSLETQVSGANLHWTGGGNPSFNWNNSANWTNDSGASAIPSTSGSDGLIFDGSVGLQCVNDFAAGAFFSSITFAPNAGPFVISGNRFSMGSGGAAGVTNFSPNLQTLNVEIQNNRNTTFCVTNGSIFNSYRLWDWVYSVNGGHDLIINQTNTANANGQISSISGARVILCAITNGPIGHGVQIDSNGVLVACGPAQQFGNDSRDNITMGPGSLFQVPATNFAGLADFQAVPMVRGSNFTATSIIENGGAVGPVQLQVGIGTSTRAGAFDGQIRDGAGGGALGVAVRNLNSVGAYWRLGGTSNSYTGETVVTNGYTASGASSTFSRLLVDGANWGGGVYTVTGNTNGAKSALGGSGLIAASTVNILSNAYLAPGGQLTGGAALYNRNSTTGADTGGFAESTGALTITNNTNVALNLTGAASTLDIHLFGTAAGQFDQVLMVATNGTFSNNFANLQLTVDLGYSPAFGDTFTIVRVPGTNSANNVGIFGTVNGLVLSTNSPGLIQGTNFLVGATRFAISYRGENNVFDMGAGNGNDVVIKVLEDTANKLTWKGDLSSDWDFTTANWRDTNNSPATITNNDKAIFTDASSNPNANLTTALSPSTILVNSTQDYTFTGGYLTGQILVSKTNSGTLTISTFNDAVGYTIIDQGTVRIGGPSGDGSLATSILVNSNGVLNYNNSGGSTFSPPSFQNFGKVIHGGSGTLTITNNYSSSWLGVTTNMGGQMQFGDAVSPGRIGGTLGVGPSSSVSYNFRGSQTIDHGLVGSGSATYFIGAGNQATITLGTVTNRGYTGTADIKYYTRVQASSSNACLNGPIIIDTPDPDFGGGSYYVSAVNITNNNAITIAGPGPSGVDTPRGKGALRLACGWAGPITMSGDATIGASGATGTILGNISDSGGGYTLEYLGGTIQVGPTAGVNTYSNTLIAEDYNGNFNSPILTIVRALNSNPFSTSVVRIRGRAQLELNGNNLSIPELIDLSTVDGGGSFSPSVWNNNTNTAATLTLGSDGDSQSFTGVFGDGAGTTAKPLGLTKVGAGTLTVCGNNTNTGPVTVAAGTLALTAAANLSVPTYTNGVAVVGGGSFGRSSVITVASLATLSVTARANGTLTLSNAQTLTGAGTLTGILSAPSGSTVSPAISAASTLTVSGNVTLGGTYLARLDRGSTPNCGHLASSGGTITYGGMLMVTNTGAALQAGDTFQLFTAGVGGFTNVSLPTLDMVNKYIYTWNNTVSSDGKVTVATAVPVNPHPPTVLQSLTGNTLHLAWPTNLGWTLLTNSAGLAANNAWFPYPASSSATNVTLTLDRSKTNVFFRMSY
jgi:autotransporter-associated beta strand protein